MCELDEAERTTGEVGESQWSSVAAFSVRKLKATTPKQEIAVKRIVTLVLTAAIALTVLVGCPKKGGGGEVGKDNPGEQKEMQDMMQKSMKAKQKG